MRSRIRLARSRHWVPWALLGAALLLAACGGDEVRVATAGDTVSVHYRGTLDSGEVFDSSLDREPFTFVMDAGQVIPGFYNAVLGLSVGETTTVRIAPAEAYGERRADLIVIIPREEAPDDILPGQILRFTTGPPAVILEVTDEMIILDANHPLAGEALTFAIELLSIE